MAVVSSTCIPDFAFYRDTYGGGLSTEEFAALLVAGTRHVAWLTDCRVPTAAAKKTAYKRAICACVDVFSEHGEFGTGGFTLGNFKMDAGRNDAPDGEELATKVAMRELAGTGLLFTGAR